GDPDHLLHLGQRRQRRRAEHVLDGLGDVDGVVADALEVGRDAERGGDEPEVARHGLLEREELDRGLLELELEPVDLLVHLDHALGLGAVAPEQGLDGEADGLLDAAGHRDEPRLEQVQLLLEAAWGGHPNLPVMYASVRSSRGFVNSVSVGPYSTSSPM